MQSKKQGTKRSAAPATNSAKKQKVSNVNEEDLGKQTTEVVLTKNKLEMTLKSPIDFEKTTITYYGDNKKFIKPKKKGEEPTPLKLNLSLDFASATPLGKFCIALDKKIKGYQKKEQFKEFKVTNCYKPEDSLLKVNLDDEMEVLDSDDNVIDLTHLWKNMKEFKNQYCSGTVVLFPYVYKETKFMGLSARLIKLKFSRMEEEEAAEVVEEDEEPAEVIEDN